MNTLQPDSQALPRMSVLGVPVDIITMPGAVALTGRWAADTRPHMVFVRDVASLMLARETPELRELHDVASLVVPDGMPLVWAGRLSGHEDSIGRVPGADLVAAVCAASARSGKRHFFYGGKPGVAEEMAAILQSRYPGLQVAGTLSPPMRDIGPDFTLSAEGLAEIEAIRATKPDFIWVGISSPKQEYWMSKAAPLLGRGVFFGVGAAFDFHSGRVKRAPEWMRNNGLEWLHRLLSEPRRLWYRYLVLAPRFAFLLAASTARNAWTERRNARNAG